MNEQAQSLYKELVEAAQGAAFLDVFDCGGYLEIEDLASEEVLFSITVHKETSAENLRICKAMAQTVNDLARDLNSRELDDTLKAQLDELVQLNSARPTLH